MPSSMLMPGTVYENADMSQKERAAHLRGCAHGLLAHLTLVHIAWGLIEVRVGRQGCHHAQHGVATYLSVAVHALITRLLGPV